MLAKFDLSKSLQELENCDWGEPMYDSHLVATCHKLRRVPLKLFNTENLRIMIGQNIGLKFLVPLALKHLQAHPLAQGDFYPGDLLVSLLRVETLFWSQNLDYCNEIHQIVHAVLLMGQKKKKRFSDSIELMREAYQLFSQNFS